MLTCVSLPSLMLTRRGRRMHWTTSRWWSTTKSARSRLPSGCSTKTGAASWTPRSCSSCCSTLASRARRRTPRSSWRGSTRTATGWSPSRSSSTTWARWAGWATSTGAGASRSTARRSTAGEAGTRTSRAGRGLRGRWSPRGTPGRSATPWRRRSPGRVTRRARWAPYRSAWPAPRIHCWRRRTANTANGALPRPTIRSGAAASRTTRRRPGAWWSAPPSWRPWRNCSPASSWPSSTSGPSRRRTTRGPCRT
mmetsp:Transcript_95253/g.255724  ORF Transcript_95253/g.255724 Transcript_95253/m.255724 type:complete len:252 (+) Transcript_95253:157-912(+)